MLLSDCVLGNNKGPLDVEIFKNSLLTEDLLKLTLKDSSQSTVNLFFEGPRLVNMLIPIKKGTRMIIQEFTTSQNFAQLSQYFPTYIIGQTVATHESTSDFFILISQNIPSIQIVYRNKTIVIDQTVDLDRICIAELYDLKKLHAAQPERLGANGKSLTLQEIIDKATKNAVNASTYAIIVDTYVSSLPKQNEQNDSLVIYRLVDSSIFPNIINLNIYYRNPKELPKVAKFGDIIKLNDVQFKEHNGAITAILSSVTKSMSFYLFTGIEEDYVPYATYRCSFHTTSEIDLTLTSLREWARSVFEKEAPLFLKLAKRLPDLLMNEEADVITRVLAICHLGVHEKDPLVCLCGESSEIFQLIIPHDKKKILQYIKPKDVVRIRGVAYEGKILSLRNYSDLLVIPDEFRGICVPENTNIEALQKYLNIYNPIPAVKRITRISDEYSKYPVVQFDKILSSVKERIIKLEGFVVRFLYRKQCIVITLWDGIMEDNIIDIYVPREKTEEFMNGKTWEEVQRDSIGYNCKFEGIIRKDNDVFRLIGTILTE